MSKLCEENVCSDDSSNSCMKCGKKSLAVSMLSCDHCHRYIHLECLMSGSPTPLHGDTLFTFVCKQCSGNEKETTSRMKLSWLQAIWLCLYNLQLTGVGGWNGYFRWRENICATIEKHWRLLFGKDRKKAQAWTGTVAGILSCWCGIHFCSGTVELGESGWWKLLNFVPPPKSVTVSKQRVNQKVGRRGETDDGVTSLRHGGLRQRKRGSCIEAAMQLKMKRATTQEAKDMRKSAKKDVQVSQERFDASPRDLEVTSSSFDTNEVAGSAKCSNSPEFESGDGNMFGDISERRGFDFTDHQGSDSNQQSTVSDTVALDDTMNEIFSCSDSSQDSRNLQNLLTGGDDEDLEIDMDSLNPDEAVVNCLEFPKFPSIHEILCFMKPTDSDSCDIVQDEDTAKYSDTKAEAVKMVNVDKSDISKTSKNGLSKKTVNKMQSGGQSYKDSKTADFNNKGRGRAIIKRTKKPFRRGSEADTINKVPGENLGCQDKSSEKDNAPERILDRFQHVAHSLKYFRRSPTLFRTRLIGYSCEPPQCIVSPYTSRVLKPYIRRDFETKPMKLRLLEEITAFPNRDKANWTAPASAPIDYCYVRPEHIPSVNNYCAEFFWPGIDLSECLHYPDFSIVVLYKKLVIGFGFLTPDVKYNEAYISFLFTHPEWRNSKIGTFMIYHLIQTCMGKDITLHVSVTNPALLLYQKFGFKSEEFLLNFYDKYLPADSEQCKHAFFLRLRR